MRARAGALPYHRAPRPARLTPAPPAPRACAALEHTLSLGLGECLDYTWTYTDAFLGGEGSSGVPEDYKLRINKVRARARARAAAGAAPPIPPRRAEPSRAPARAARPRACRARSRTRA